MRPGMTVVGGWTDSPYPSAGALATALGLTIWEPDSNRVPSSSRDYLLKRSPHGRRGYQVNMWSSCETAPAVVLGLIDAQAPTVGIDGWTEGVADLPAGACVQDIGGSLRIFVLRSCRGCRPWSAGTSVVAGSSTMPGWSSPARELVPASESLASQNFADSLSEGPWVCTCSASGPRGERSKRPKR